MSDIMCDNQNENQKFICNLVKNTYNFFIPSYQRGYRWTEQEVNALLEDINEIKESEKYCIQPLIVKKIENETKYEVVDGQQRLTTILIILKILGKETYRIEYESREDSGKFLDNIVNPDEDSNSNIDFYHMYQAKECITNWLDTKDKELFKNKLLQQVFFIWYELTDSENAVDVFTKINMGKIQLTNAELIKAIIFNKNNFGNEIERYQQEIALSWDRIERELQQDSFWYFITGGETYTTRLDFLFDLYVEKLENKEDIKSNQYYTFLQIYGEYKNKKDKKKFVMDDLWKKIEKYYETFLEWYEDIDRYHLIGYLINSKSKKNSNFEKKKEIYDLLLSEDKKSEQKKKLIEKIECKIKDKLNNNYKKSQNNYEKSQNNKDFQNFQDFQDLFKEINYEYEKKDLRNLFLLINIASLINNDNKHYRFPFDIYQKEKWDIEHIHAKADNSNTTTDEQDKEERDIEHIHTKADQSNQTTEAQDNDEDEDFHIDNIYNLTLLPKQTNIKISNKTFKDKRMDILSIDKNGKFIPICSKNVYFKYYTNEVTNMDRWKKNDREDYVEAIYTILDEFFKLAQKEK